MYAAAGLVLTLVAAGVATLVVPAAGTGAIWFAAGLAYTLQLVAFAALVAVRDRHHLFLLGWMAGMVLRFLAVGVVAYWLTHDPVFPRGTALISLVGFVFLLLLLEPLFLRRHLHAR
jgi:hypothetical protein